jgi:DNA-binding XRE family transcriptional regulator
MGFLRKQINARQRKSKKLRGNAINTRLILKSILIGEKIMVNNNQKTTTNALEIIDNLYFKGRPEMYALLDEARERRRLSAQLLELRQQKKLTQQELATRAGTSRTVIARLEQPGYEKHTMSTLRKVAGAMGFSVKVEFVPMESIKHSIDQDKSLNVKG